MLFLHYVMNKSYYATVLCENKAKPKMHCNGHCRLAKELKEQEKQEKLPLSNLKEKTETIVYVQPVKISVTNTVQNPDTKFVSYEENIQQGFGQAIFHPPIVA
jgi:dynactin complex subunit